MVKFRNLHKTDADVPDYFCRSKCHVGTIHMLMLILKWISSGFVHLFIFGDFFKKVDNFKN